MGRFAAFAFAGFRPREEEAQLDPELRSGARTDGIRSGELSRQEAEEIADAIHEQRFFIGQPSWREGRRR